MPKSFSVTIDSVANTTAYLSWTEAVDPDGDSTWYDIYLNDSLIASKLRDLEYHFSGLSPGANYIGKIVASDPFDNLTKSCFSFSTKSATLLMVT